MVQQQQAERQGQGGVGGCQAPVQLKDQGQGARSKGKGRQGQEAARKGEEGRARQGEPEAEGAGQAYGVAPDAGSQGGRGVCGAEEPSEGIHSHEAVQDNKQGCGGGQPRAQAEQPGQADVPRQGCCPRGEAQQGGRNPAEGGACAAGAQHGGQRRCTAAGGDGRSVLTRCCCQRCGGSSPTARGRAGSSSTACLLEHFRHAGAQVPKRRSHERLHGSPAARVIAK
mmetsp:Transcript_57504/g.171128  ORF Transcript_57504/g.171128 Transcript_57504/m.171128 type:complete len:226 (-) Transcript_57504:97-774(-)